MKTNTIAGRNLNKEFCPPEPVQIFFKLKPFSKDDQIPKEDQRCYIYKDTTTIEIKPPKQSMYFKNHAQKEQLSNHILKFTNVFQSKISQKDFFAATLLPCFDRLISGENLLIFSYGVTNSGKTYSMQGNSKNSGLIPRTLNLLFNVIKDNSDVKKSYKYKPDKFNEIISLNDNELQQAFDYKESLLKMCSNFKYFDHTLNDFDVNDSDQEQKIVIPVENKYAIWVSFYELYNDFIYDLLVPAGKKVEKRNPLKIREDSVHIPYFDGKTARENFIKSNKVLRIFFIY
jgi:hypothetical protein